MKFSKSNCLKIGALNCQGLEGKLDFPELYNLINASDIFGVTETWLTLGKDDECFIDGYKFYPLSRKKEKGANRGGVGLFIKKEWKEHIKIRYDLSCENFLWCKMSKSFFGFHDDVYVAIVYFPPESSTREKRANMDHFQNLKESVRRIDSDNVILMGDFNARTNNISDVIIGEKDEDDLDQVGFFSKIDTRRRNQDQTVNQYGRQLIEYCIATRSYIANGRTIGDLQGKYTCHEYNGSSTVDYAVISENLRDRVQSFRVCDPDTGSDHSPIELDLSLPFKLEQKNNSYTKLPPKIIWNETTKVNFELKMKSPNTLCKINELQDKYVFSYSPQTPTPATSNLAFSAVLPRLGLSFSIGSSSGSICTL